MPVGMADPGSPGGRSGQGGRRGAGGRTGLLIGAAVVVAAAAAAGVVLAPKVFHQAADPGCKVYTGTALTAYDQAISDLNAQASQAKLTSDMSAAIVSLQNAAAQAQSASVRSALDRLLGQLNTVRTDVENGSVPTSTVSALNTAANAADSAC
jgi:hypothetical protein